MFKKMIMFVCLSLLLIAAMAVPRTVTPRGPLFDEELNNIKIFEQASGSVVHVTTVAVARNAFSLNVFEIPKGTGTGFFWDDQGHIVTNFHVIQGGSFAQITLSDQSSYRAKVVGIAPERDLAVLKIDIPKQKCKPLPLGESANLKVGQKTYAIGNPFGLDQTLTTGIVSALGREINSVIETPIKNVIQTDAAINPGNSGGPLLDSAGRLVGVNTAILSPSGTYAGIGFAIPTETVNWVVPELIANGKVLRPSLGVSVASSYVNERFDISGALILKVDRGSAAEKAGLRSTRTSSNGDFSLGDIVKAVDGDEIKTGEELLAKIVSYKVGDQVTLTIQRGRSVIKVAAILAKE